MELILRISPEATLTGTSDIVTGFSLGKSFFNEVEEITFIELNVSMLISDRIN